MDPNDCMARLLAAVRDENREECDAALDDLVEWLDRGGFPPKFTTEMAGLTRHGEPKRWLGFYGPCKRSIQTVNHGNDAAGWELVTWTYGGEKHKSWRLAQ